MNDSIHEKKLVAFVLLSLLVICSAVFVVAFFGI